MISVFAWSRAVIVRGCLFSQVAPFLILWLDTADFVKVFCGREGSFSGIMGSSVTVQAFLRLPAVVSTLESLLHQVILCVSPSVSPVVGAAVCLMFSPLLRILEEFILVSFSVWLAVYLSR